MKQTVKIILLTLTAFLIPEIIGSVIDGLIGYFFDWYQIGLAIAICSTVFFISFCKKRQIKLLNTEHLKQGIIYLIPLILSIVLTLIQLQTNQRTYAGLSFGVFSLAIMAGVSEEVAFRAVPQSFALKVDPSKSNMLRVTLVTSTLFALLHLTNAFGGVKPLFVLYQVILSFCVGIFFSAIFIKTKNILLPILAHSLNDFVAFLDAGSTTNGLITSQTFTYLELIDAIFALIYLIIGIYLLNRITDDELNSLWGEEITKE